MGILNLPQTSHLVMPMNSEARDLGDPNKHMRSTNIRLFISNSIFYMIRFIQNTSITPIPAQLRGVVAVLCIVIQPGTWEVCKVQTAIHNNNNTGSVKSLA